MRVLLVSGIFHPEVGGPATYLHELAHALVAAGHEVGVLSYGEDDPPARYPFPVWRVSRRGSIRSRLLRFTRRLAVLGRRYPLWYVNDYGVPALLAAPFSRPVVVMKIVGDFAWEYSRRHGLTTLDIDEFQHAAAGRQQLLRRLQAAYVGRAARVIVPSEYLAGIVRGWGVDPARVRVVHNAVRVPPPPDPAAPREPVVLTAARLAPWKGLEHLLDAFAIVAARVPEARLVVAGDGPSRASLERRAVDLGIAPRVEWAGSLPRPDLLERMARASAFVLLSRYEGFSHVLLEALASGVPVVASDVGGNRELIADGAGWLVAPDATGEVAARIEALLTDSAHRTRAARAALDHGTTFSWPRLYERTVSVFHEALADARPSP